jgi:hypothetical protein
LTDGIRYLRPRRLPHFHGSTKLASSLLVVSSARAISAGFIENRGQQNAAVRFYRPGAPADCYFTAQGVVVDLKQWRPGPRAGGDAGDDEWDLGAPPPVPGGIAPGDTLVGCAVYIRFGGQIRTP